MQQFTNYCISSNNWRWGIFLENINLSYLPLDNIPKPNLDHLQTDRKIAQNDHLLYMGKHMRMMLFHLQRRGSDCCEQYFQPFSDKIYYLYTLHIDCMHNHLKYSKIFLFTGNQIKFT